MAAVSKKPTNEKPEWKSPLLYKKVGPSLLKRLGACSQQRRAWKERFGTKAVPITPELFAEARAAEFSIIWALSHLVNAEARDALNRIDHEEWNRHVSERSEIRAEFFSYPKESYSESSDKARAQYNRKLDALGRRTDKRTLAARLKILFGPETKIPRLTAEQKKSIWA